MEKGNIGLIECRIRGYLFLIILLIGGVVFCLYKQSAFCRCGKQGEIYYCDENYGYYDIIADFTLGANKIGMERNKEDGRQTI